MSKKINISYQSEMVDYLTINKKPFKCSFTIKGSKIVKTNGFEFIGSEDRVNYNLISKVHKEGKEWCSRNGFIDTDFISCETAKIVNLSEGLYKDFVEIDISSAYATEAFRIGAISKSTYEWLTSNRVSKKDRLMAIGALATNKFSFEFDGKSISEISHKRKDTSSLFFLLSRNIYNLMLNLHNECSQRKKGGSIGFWVDAIFVKRELLEFVQGYFLENGFSCKHSEITSMKVIVKETVKYIYMNERKKTDDSDKSSGIRIKVFTVPGFGVKVRKRRASDRAIDILNTYFGE